MKIAIGVDPDTTNTAIALVEVSDPEKPDLIATYSIKQKGKRERNATLAMVEELVGIFENRDAALPPGSWMERISGHDPIGKWVVAVAVEGQEIYKGGQTKNPRSILWLAPIAGAFMALFRILYPEAMMLFPSPAGWKGQTPKQIHHNRIGKRMGWEMQNSGTAKTGYAYPLNAEPNMDNGINDGDWKHLMDAVGLALYAAEQYDKAQAKKSSKGGKS